MGFAPIKHGSIQGAGMVVRDDSFNYFGPKVSRIDIEVTDTQRQAILKFAESPKAHGFDMRYQGGNNSCVDFAFKALEVAGLNPRHFEGRVIPTGNLSELKQLARDIHHSPAQQSQLHTERARATGPMPESESRMPLQLQDTTNPFGSRELATAFRELPRDQALKRHPELERAYHAQDAARLHVALPRDSHQSHATFMQVVNSQIERQLNDFGANMTDPRKPAPTPLQAKDLRPTNQNPVPNTFGWPL
jgi:hypothetical protein